MTNEEMEPRRDLWLAEDTYNNERRWLDGWAARLCVDFRCPCLYDWFIFIVFVFFECVFSSTKNKKRFSSNHYFVSVYLDTHTRIQTKRQKEEETLLGEYALYSLYFNHTILTALKMYTSDTFYYPDGVKRVYKTKTVKPSHRGDFLEHISSQFLEQVRK